MAFDATNYKSFVSNLFVKPRSGTTYSSVYFKEIGKLYRLTYGGLPLFVKNLEIGGTNNASPLPQMVGETGRLMTTNDGILPTTTHRSRRIGPEVATVKFPKRTITLSGIATISDSGASENPWAWLELLQDSIDYAMKKFYDPDFDTSYGPNVQSVNLDLAADGLNWSITWEADGQSYKNFFQNLEEQGSDDLIWSAIAMEGAWPDDTSTEYHDRYRIIKWYDTLIYLNGDLFDYPGTSTEKEFYSTKISLTWKVDNKRFFDFGTNNYSQLTDYQVVPPIYVPVKISQDFSISGLSPVSVADEDFISTAHTGTVLFQRAKSEVSKPFYLRFGDKTHIDYADKYITLIDNSEGKNAYTMLRDAKYIQSPEMPTRIDLSGLIIYS